MGLQLALLRPCQQSVHLLGSQPMERRAMRLLGFGIQCSEAATPSFAQGRHAGVAIAVAGICQELSIDKSRNGDRRPVGGLWNDPAAYSLKRQPFVLVEETRFARRG